jgi:hypothetical protein
MPELSVHLREGFYRTPVAVYLDGKERFRSDSVTTRMQIGLAEIVTLEVPEGRVDIEIQFPAEQAKIGQTIEVLSETHVGINLGENGLPISLDVQRESFFYM